MAHLCPPPTSQVHFCDQTVYSLNAMHRLAEALFNHQLIQFLFVYLSFPFRCVHAKQIRVNKSKVVNTCVPATHRITSCCVVWQDHRCIGCNASNSVAAGFMQRIDTRLGLAIKHCSAVILIATDSVYGLYWWDALSFPLNSCLTNVLLPTAATDDDGWCCVLFVHFVQTPLSVSGGHRTSYSSSYNNNNNVLHINSRRIILRVVGHRVLLGVLWYDLIPFSITFRNTRIISI